jgi:hypothetical protein
MPIDLKRQNRAPIISASAAEDNRRAEKGANAKLFVVVFVVIFGLLHVIGAVLQQHPAADVLPEISAFVPYAD